MRYREANDHPRQAAFYLPRDYGRLWVEVGLGRLA